MKKLFFSPGLVSFCLFCLLILYLTGSTATAGKKTGGALLPQTITFAPLPEKTFGDADFDPGAISTNTSIPITYASDNPAVAIIVSNKVVIVGIGNANITASQAGSDIYSPAVPVTRLLKVNPVPLLPQTITFPAIPVKMLGDADFDPGATSTNLTNPITYTSDNIAVAEIINGMISIKGIGFALITAKQPRISDYMAAVPVSRTLEVRAPQTQVITFSPIADKTYGDAIFDPGATSTNLTIPVLYSSSNAAVVSIINGKATISGTGQVTITARQAGNSVYLPAIPKEQAFLVVPAVLTISADNKSRQVNVENPLLTVTIIGFVYGEAPEILMQTPLVSTTADVSSLPGVYPIIVQGACAANYIIQYRNGLLKINSSLKIPNTFTPNGDGINDTWKIASLADFPGCQVSIFNRYGAMVYSSRGYNKDWDGTRNNAALPAGTYYYLIDLKDSNPVISGYIMILR